MKLERSTRKKRPICVIQAFTLVKIRLTHSDIMRRVREAVTARLSLTRFRHSYQAMTLSAVAELSRSEPSLA